MARMDEEFEELDRWCKLEFYFLQLSMILLDSEGKDAVHGFYVQEEYL